MEIFDTTISRRHLDDLLRKPGELNFRFLTMKMIIKLLLGSPFTPCIHSGEQAVTGGEDDLWQQNNQYKEHSCLQIYLMHQIIKNCGCYLSYIDELNMTARDYGLSACTFSQHARCASNIIRQFEWANRKVCPLACSSSGFSQESIQVCIL